MMDFYRAWRNGAKEREKPSAAHRTRTFIPLVIDFAAINAFEENLIEYYD